MPNRKISDLTELISTPADDDLIQVVDVSDTTYGPTGTNKKIQYSNLLDPTKYFVLTGGAYVSGSGSFYYLPTNGTSQFEQVTPQWYSKLPVNANCRLVDVALYYQRGSAGRTINLTAYDFNEPSGPGQVLGSSTNGPLDATSTSGGVLQFDFDTSDFDLTTSSQFGLAINLAGSTTTILGLGFNMRFKFL